MKNWDVIVIGGGIIGLSLSIELRKSGAGVLVVERGEPGREASHAAGGMLVDCPLETPAALQPLATASARMYPEFAHELEIESGMKVDLRDQGTILFPSAEHLSSPCVTSSESSRPSGTNSNQLSLTLNRPPFYLHERSVDPRALTAAALQTAKRRGVDISSGDEVTAINRFRRTSRRRHHDQNLISCRRKSSTAQEHGRARLPPSLFPPGPVKGQMLCLLSPSHNLLKHVIRAPEVYLIPRSDGRILVGATVEEAGFDKRTDVETIQRLHRAAIALVPELRNAKILEDWAGLRPGTPDALPILGATATPGYYVATGHFRDGILLAPITAQVMAEVIDRNESATMT